MKRIGFRRTTSVSVALSRLTFLCSLLSNHVHFVSCSRAATKLPLLTDTGQNLSQNHMKAEEGCDLRAGSDRSRGCWEEEEEEEDHSSPVSSSGLRRVI